MSLGFADAKLRRLSAEAASQITDNEVLRKTIRRLERCVEQLTKRGFTVHARNFQIMLEACEEEQEARNAVCRTH